RVRERERSEAAGLVAVALVLDDQRASMLDVLQQPRGVLAHIVANEVGVRPDDDLVERRQVRVGEVVAAELGDAEPEALQGTNDRSEERRVGKSGDLGGGSIA